MSVLSPTQTTSIKAPNDYSTDGFSLLHRHKNTARNCTTVDSRVRPAISDEDEAERSRYLDDVKNFYGVYKDETAQKQ